MKIQKNTKGKGVLKFGLSEEENSEKGASEAESSNVRWNKHPGTQKINRKKKGVKGVADQQPSFK